MLFYNLELDSDDKTRELLPFFQKIHDELNGSKKPAARLKALLASWNGAYKPEGQRLCVSLCGSQRALLQTQQHMATTKLKLRGNTDVSFELAADYHS